MFYFLSLASYVVYSFLVTSLFLTSLMSSISSGHIIVSLLKIIVIIFLLYEIIVEWRIYLYPKKSNLLQRHFNKQDLYIFIAVFLGTLCTYLMNHNFALGAVVASSLLGLTFGLILPNIFSNGQALAVALFCGTFIGMSTATKLSTRISVMIASIIGTIIFLYTAPYFAGLGGKLGLIAFGSSIATAGIYNLKSHIKHKTNIFE